MQIKRTLELTTAAKSGRKSLGLLIYELKVQSDVKI